MFTLTKQNGSEQYGKIEFVADDRSDIATLPLEDILPGSTCLVVEDSSVWILSPSKRWVEL